MNVAGSGSRSHFLGPLTRRCAHSAFAHELYGTTGHDPYLIYRRDPCHGPPPLGYEDVFSTLHGVKIPAEVGLKDADRGPFHVLTIMVKVKRTQ